MTHKSESSKRLELKQSPASVYDFTVDDLKHNPVSLSKYKGKVLMVTNVAAL